MVKNHFDVIFCVPPFASTLKPAIGVSILKSHCEKLGLNTIVRYSNLSIAQLLGVKDYEKIAYSSFSLMIGEVLFRELAFPNKLGETRDFLIDFFNTHGPLKTTIDKNVEVDLQLALKTLDVLPHFVKSEAHRLSNFEAKIIGFSSMFQQTNASIALANEVKKLRPSTNIVFGGPNFDGEMGREISSICPSVDYVFSGEADQFFPTFAKHLIESGEKPTSKIITCSPTKFLDDVESPEYGDYFHQLKKITGIEIEELQLPIETSRGCWWGQKNHCTFCGLNANGMNFRRKSDTRIQTELKSIIERFGVRRFQATDNIMPINFCEKVLQEVRTEIGDLDFFYEVKSNLKSRDLDAFVRNGVNTVQPGIESLSSSILKRINKGVSGTKNLWLLREAASRKIGLVWNLLVDIPGDHFSDYSEMMTLFPKIVHLEPPDGLSPILIDRFSPYHKNPELFSINHITPLKSYEYAFPSDCDLSKIAYHFVGDYSSAWRQHSNLKVKFTELVIDWQALWNTSNRPPVCYGVNLEDGRLFIEDTRFSERQSRYILSSSEAQALSSFEKPRPVNKTTMTDKIQKLINLNLVVKHEEFFVSLVTDPNKAFQLRKTS